MRKVSIFYLLLASIIYSPTFGQQVLTSEFIYDEALFPSCHASTLAETPRGIVAAWFGGTHENNPDVEIYFSRKATNGWTTPISIANGIQHTKKRYPCWNPVLFQVPDGPLVLFYKVGPTPSAWWGEVKESNDGGETWSESRRLPEDILGPVKNKPVLLADGRLLCPSSRETEIEGEDYWQVFVEETTDWGKSWKISEPLNDGVKYDAIQPSILNYGNGKLQMLCRSRESVIVNFWSEDNGKTWGEISPTNLPNPNSGTDAVTLQDGRQLLIYNPTSISKGKWGGPRSPIDLAISTDGINWDKFLRLEDTPGELSYPAIIQATDGSVHLTYTHQRKQIKYVHLKL
jgi:predicted neuraminidase